MTDDASTPRLSEMQLAFCRHYVQGHKGAEAARRAGYAASNAKQQAHDLLRDPRILAEIERLKAELGVKVIAPKPKVIAMDGEIIGPNQQTEAEEEAAAIEAVELSRKWAIDTLIRNVQVAMGDRKVTQTRILKVRSAPGAAPPSKDEPPEAFTAIQIEAYERDASAANQGLALLLKECDRMEGKPEAGDPEKPDAPAVRRNPELAARLRAFRAGLNTPPRAAAPAANGATNGHANGANGHG